MLLDSTVFIDFLKGEDEVVKSLKKEEELATSVILVMEVMAGLKNKKEAKKFERFLAKALIKVYPLTEEISQLAFDLFKGYFYSHHLGIADALIAATAIINQETLVTENLRHFRAVKNLKLQKL